MVSVKLRAVPSVRVDTPMVVGSAPEVPTEELVVIQDSRAPILRAVDELPAERPWLAEMMVSMSRLISAEALASW